MTKQAILIDNIAFAKKHDSLAGNLSLTECARLSDLLQSMSTLTSQANTINYVLQGKIDSLGQAILQLTITCKLSAVCQRCLNAMPLNLNLKFNYLIGEVSDTYIEALEIDSKDDYDMQQASKNMDLTALIEDEIIMAMPIAPKHEEGCSQCAMQSGEKPNPFAVLKGLIKP